MSGKLILPTNVAVVLAAGDLPPSLAAIFGHTSSAMLPINGRPTIHWNLSYLAEIGIRKVVIGIKASEQRLPKFIRQSFGRVLELVFQPIEEDKGPGFTLLQCLKALDERNPLVVLGDTLFQFPVEKSFSISRSFVLTAAVQDAKRWCLADVATSGVVAALADKPEKNPDDWPALIGVYYLHDRAEVIASLQKELDAGRKSVQLRHALEPLIEAGLLDGWAAGEWLDCGNLDFLTSSKRRLLQARSFNTIQIDELRGAITKRSTHIGKFLNEINYYRLLPNDLAIFFPRLVDYSLKPGNVYLTLEYYGYSTLSEIWVFEEFDPAYWEIIFATLNRILDEFQLYTVEISKKAAFNFYWQKTVDRLEDFSQQHADFKALIDSEEIVLNEIPLQGWGRLKDWLCDEVTAIAETVKGQIIHGDLCFPNILYDPVSRLFKLLDPRGSFAESGIYGDVRYDLAKLLHSLDGGYDFLIHDMFALKENGTRFELQLFSTDARPSVIASFVNVFSKQYNLREVRILEGLLFLSMCPLHQDFPRRQKAMFCTGLRILNEVYSGQDMTAA